MKIEIQITPNQKEEIFWEVAEDVRRACVAFFDSNYESYTVEEVAEYIGKNISVVKFTLFGLWEDGTIYSRKDSQGNIRYGVARY